MMVDYYLFSHLIEKGNIKIPEVFCGIIVEEYEEYRIAKVKIQKINNLEEFLNDQNKGLGDCIILKPENVRWLPVIHNRRYKPISLKEE